MKINTASLLVMSIAELKELVAKIEAQIPKTQFREREAARNEIERMLAAKGYTIQDVIGIKPRKQRSKPGTKYRDKQTGVIWAGRGRMPHNFDKARAEQVAA